MDAILPAFVLGYHGCDASLADAVVDGSDCLRPSQNDYDWLGSGIYFWENSPLRAYDFACEMQQASHPSRQRIETPAAIGAIINLGYCLNLLDSRYIGVLKKAHSDLIADFEAAKMPLPRNTGGPDLVARKLDCAVVSALHQNRAEEGAQPPFDTARAAFFEGGKLYENSGFAARGHIQVCVREARSILGYFHPLDEQGRVDKFRSV